MIGVIGVIGVIHRSIDPSVDPPIHPSREKKSPVPTPPRTLRNMNVNAIRSFPLPSVSYARPLGALGDGEGVDEERHAFETQLRHCRFCWAQLDEGCDDYVAPCDCKGSMVRAALRDGGLSHHLPDDFGD